VIIRQGFPVQQMLGKFAVENEEVHEVWHQKFLDTLGG
jgi:hypothetical protein